MSALTISTPAPPCAGASPTVRLLPAPVMEPRPARRVNEHGTTPVPAHQGTLALGTVGRGSRAGARQAPPAGAADELSVPTRQWIAQFVQAAVEVSAGLRPATQLVRWTSEDVQATLARRCALSRRLAVLPGRRSAAGAGPARTGAGPTGPARTGGRSRAVVRSVRGSSPRSSVIEACAVVCDQERSRAVAVRLELLDERWRVTAFELG